MEAFAGAWFPEKETFVQGSKKQLDKLEVEEMELANLEKEVKVASSKLID